MGLLDEWLKKFLASLSHDRVFDLLLKHTTRGYDLGHKVGTQEIDDQGRKWEYQDKPKDPDTEAIKSIGVRAHALSEKTISEAKGNLAFEVDKLYKEMDAAMKAGMTEKEALVKIQDRIRGLFSGAFPQWKLERLVRDQFLVATKEGRRAAWQEKGVKYRQWVMHLDSKTAADSKRMNGQIAKIDEPYVDPETDERYMIPHIRPNDRCFEMPLYELPETKEKDGLLYAKVTIGDFSKYSCDIFFKGGVGYGIKGHTTPKKITPKERKIIDDYNTGVKKLAQEYKAEKSKGNKSVQQLQKEFKEKFEQHREASIKSFMGEHKFTREQAKARKQARKQKQSPVEAKPEPKKDSKPTKPKQSDEDKKAKRKARRDARKHRKVEEEKKKQEEEKKQKEQQEKKTKPKKPTDNQTVDKNVKSQIMNDPDVKEFLSKVKGTPESLEEDLKQIKDFDKWNRSILDWQDCQFENMDHLTTQVFGLSNKGTRARTRQWKNKDWFKEQVEGQDKSLKQYYALTQKFLEQKYPDGYVEVYRGVNGGTYDQFKGQNLDKGSACNLECYNTSSWTLDKGVAGWFAKKKQKAVIIKAKIPIERVLVHPDVLGKHNLHDGYNIQKEIVLLGNTVNGEVESMSEVSRGERTRTSTGKLF